MSRSSEPSDEILLAGLSSRDPTATAAFVRRFHRRVFGLAFLILADAAAADDVAQETFLRVWRFAGAYDARRGPVGPWVLSIARNLAIDQSRMRRWAPVEPSSLLFVEAPSPDPGPEEQAVALGEFATLREALAALPAEQRRAVVLAAFFGRTSREIAESEGIPVGTAKTRIRTGMLKLRAVMEAER